MNRKKQLVPVLAALLLLAALAAGCTAGHMAQQTAAPDPVPAPTAAPTPDPTPVPTLSGEPRPILEAFDLDPDGIEKLTYSFYPFGERTLYRGEGGFDQVLDLLGSLRGTPVKPQRSVDRMLRLDDGGIPLILGSDGARVYASLGWSDFQLLDTDGRPDEELEAIFASYAPAPMREPVPFDPGKYKNEGGLVLTAAQPGYAYLAMQKAITISFRRFYDVDGGAPEEGALVRLTAENRGDGCVVYLLPGLLALRDGEWQLLPTYSPRAATFERRGLQPGESLDTGLDMDFYADPLTPGQYCAYMIYAVADGNKDIYDRIACAPFEITGEVPDDGTEPLMGSAKKEKVRRIAYSMSGWDERSLEKGDEGFDEALELLWSLRGTPCERPEILVSRSLEVGSVRNVRLAYDGERVYGQMTADHWLLLDTEGRPDQQLTNIFLRWGEEPEVYDPYPAADKLKLEDGSLTAVMDEPVYCLETVLSSINEYFMRCREYGKEAASEVSDAFSVRFRLENHTDEWIDMDFSALQVQLEGAWYVVPFRHGTSFFMLGDGLGAGERSDRLLPLVLFDEQNLKPGRYRISVPYRVGETTKGYDHIAYAEFTLTESTSD